MISDALSFCDFKRNTILQAATRPDRGGRFYSTKERFSEGLAILYGETFYLFNAFETRN